MTLTTVSTTVALPCYTVIVNFQLRSSIHAGLTEHWFCIEKSAKMGFLGDIGGGAKIFGLNPPRNAMTADHAP